MAIAATTGGSDGFDVKKFGVKKKWAVSGWKKILSEERLLCGRAIFSSMILNGVKTTVRAGKMRNPRM